VEKSISTAEHRHLAAVLLQLRMEAGLRQEDVAERLGEPQSFVSKYENNERRLDLVELQQVARALGSSLVEVVERFERAE